MQARRLAIAFGSRGKGRALAHYEPARVVINLTKMKGAGSLAHEWGHAFDDWLGIKCGTHGLRTFLSENCTNKRMWENSKYLEIVQAMLRVVETMRMKRISPDELKSEIREKQADTLSGIMEKFSGAKEKNSIIINDILQSWNKESLALTSKLQEYKGKDTKVTPEFQDLLDEFTAKQDDIVSLELAIETYNRKVSDFEETPSFKSILDVKRALEGIARFVPYNDRSDFLSSTFDYDIVREVRAYDRFGLELRTLERDPDYLDKKCRVKTKYYESALKLDEGRKQRYYSEVVEMFARAFESYIESSLHAKGLKSEYLVHSTTSNEWYNGYSPYPVGEEREQICEAIQSLINIARKTFECARDDGIDYGVYQDKNSWKSYQQSVSTIKLPKSRTSKTNARTQNIAEEPQGLQGLREQIVRIGANASSRKLAHIPITSMLNKFAALAKARFGYSAIGIGNFKKYKAKGQGNSKGFAYISLKSGRAIMLDDNAKPEKQLEGLIEAIVRDAVYKGYGETTAASMLAEGVTYTLCKQYNLDVRTYCLSGDFEVLSKNTSQSKSYLNICMRIYKELANTVFNLGA